MGYVKKRLPAWAARPQAQHAHSATGRPAIEEEFDPMEDLNETLHEANELFRTVTDHPEGVPFDQFTSCQVRDCLRELRTFDDAVAVQAHTLLAEAAAARFVFEVPS